MTRYGFVIDQDACIGCHACTVACKSEHDVPLGVNRTWVKYIETGTFPDTQRKFSVMRCNHCEDAPCVAVCPTTALFQRDDGIVDFDSSACIGCKACMNACPYDAIYMDPVTDSAAKCNYCAHRVDAGLEPACVPVCPTQAIVAGDMDDPTTRISRMLAREKLQVRAPEQGTGPKVFYKGADQACLDPLRSRIPPDGMIWADVTDGHASLPILTVRDTGPAGGAVPARGAAATSAPVPDRFTEPARTVYTTAHELPWKWKVTAYLVTKSVAAGVLMIAGLLVLLGHASSLVVRAGAPLLGLAMALATGALLVWDLRQPRRFYYLFTRRANWRSWLVKGAVVLLAYGVVGGLWFLAGVLALDRVLLFLAIPALLAGAATGGYTAFLFAQCEGRDLWQSPLVLPVLLGQAVAAGAAGMLVLALALGLDAEAVGIVRFALGLGLAAVVLFALLELSSRSTRHVEAACRIMSRGAERGRFWTGIGLMVVAAVGAVLGPLWVAALAGIAGVAGIAVYEHAFVRAGQLVPLS